MNYEMNRRERQKGNKDRTRRGNVSTPKKRGREGIHTHMHTEREIT